MGLTATRAPPQMARGAEEVARLDSQTSRDSQLLTTAILRKAYSITTLTSENRITRPFRRRLVWIRAEVADEVEAARGSTTTGAAVVEEAEGRASQARLNGVGGPERHDCAPQRGGRDVPACEASDADGFRALKQKTRHTRKFVCASHNAWVILQHVRSVSLPPLLCRELL